jgi:hypothetical protein
MQADVTKAGSSRDPVILQTNTNPNAIVAETYMLLMRGI